MDAFTVEHFERYASLMVFDDGEKRGLERWQLELVEDLFSGYRRNLWIIPEGNGKSTLVSLIALYGADFSDSPWIPVGAAGAKQARIIHQQASGFIERTPGLDQRFRVYDGYLKIASRVNGGQGIEVFAHDPKTGDGVIPYPYAILDELGNQPDMRLWNLWASKLRKRNAQIVGISTSGEPETPFENMRDSVRRRAIERRRDGSHLRAASEGTVLHEWMVAKDDDCTNMKKVKAANPLTAITEKTLAEDFAEVDDLGLWKRNKCNRPVRSNNSAITDKEWDDAQVSDEIPANARVDVGLDVGWKHDTTAFVPLFVESRYKLLGPATVLKPPRDGSSMHPDVIKSAFHELASMYHLETVIMDLHRAEDIGAWAEDELGVTVIDREQGNKHKVADYEAFMDGLRNGTLKHTGCPDLRSHVLHAIARRLPGGNYRFDRPSQVRANKREQDRRVIDALDAAAMAVEYTNRKAPATSVYEERYG